MKKLLIVLGFVMAFGPAASMASVDLATQVAIQSVTPLNLIDWKVGDSAEYNVSLGGMNFGGKMTKAVTKDEGTAIWVHQDVNLMIQKQVVDTLISKADGKILKMLVDGKEQSLPDDQIEIISQDYAEVTVPAGKFQAIHITAKTKQIKSLEIWVNPRDTVMEGMIKQNVDTGMFPMSMELVSFKRAQ